jgi:hypothetical protein
MSNPSTSKPDLWTDIGFAAIFALCLVFTGLYAYKAFKVNPQMISLPNMLVVVLIQLTLLSKSRYLVNQCVSKTSKSYLSHHPRGKLQLRHSFRELGDV